MIGLFRQYKFLVLAVLLTVGLLFGLGYFFAKQKSEPEFATKIDRIIFERKNKSPKFIITLPEAAISPKGVLEEAASVLSNTEHKESANEEKEKGFSAIDLIDKIPLVSKLQPIANPQPLNPLQTISALSEEVGGLLLPKVSESGKKPWIEYGKTEKVQPNFYKVAIVLKNLGMDSMVTTAAIETMPSNISLSFSPYGKDLDSVVRHAREFGHETYVDWLLCSKNFLKADNGPMAMSVTQNKEENVRRAEASLNVRAPIGGMVVNSGIADEGTREHQQAIMENLQKRGLLLIDATDEDGISQIRVSGLARRKADILIETQFVREYIEKQLKKAEQLAKDNGSVLIAATPKPVVLHILKEWVATFSPQMTYEQMKEQNTVPEKPLALVPVSNLVVE